MGGVSNGQRGNQDTFNNAFVTKSGDSTIVGKINLRSGTGDNVDDVQDTVNDILDNIDLIEADISDLEAWDAAHASTTNAHTATNISVEKLGTPTYSSVQDFIKTFGSSGRISGGVISAVDATHVSVTGGAAMLRISNSALASIIFCNFDANTNLLITANATNYIYLDYNSGTPIIAATTTRTSINNYSQIVLGAVWGDGAETPHFVNTGMNLPNWESLEHQRIVECRRIERASGGVVSSTGTRNIATTDAVVYIAGVRITFSGKNTSGSDKMKFIYRNGSGGWTIEENKTQIDNTQYDDGDGGLATLTANRYGTRWVYLLYDGSIYVQYGQGDYTLAQAQAAPVPATSSELTDFAVLAAKIIVQKSSDTLIITSAYNTLFPINAPATHNDLAGLQGGDTNYYHTTAAQNALLPLNAASTDNSTTGANATMPTPSNLVCRLTNGSLTSIDMISNPVAGHVIILINRTGVEITLNHLTGGTSANQINTGTGANLKISNNASVWLVYDGTTTKWQVVGGSGAGGGSYSVNSDVALGASDTIAVTQDMLQSWRVGGNSAAVDLSSTPFGTTPPPDRARISLFGVSDDYTVTLTENDATHGCVGFGDSYTLTKYSHIEFEYSSDLARYICVSKT